MWRYLRRLLPWAFLYICFGFAVFKFQRGAPYDDECWSPNHEYFMVRRESLVSSWTSRHGDRDGWVLIYDKYGKLLHRWDGGLSSEGGPWWSGTAIHFFNEPQATLDLPTDAGRTDLVRLCY
ncbi:MULTISPECIES: hypothetical protein [unclassified Cupriavidus]|uniref:hypothetical protein n=1 Tax=unclassified Cupriavidus TaxID=2640874 RepID=UPI0028B2885C|nr:hypothetical protein [Cupriavidus sp. SZY C1]MDT6962177.1 hypothetical protein [Cupriavidus sp. SZY C1]